MTSWGDGAAPRVQATTVLPWIDPETTEPQVSHGCLARDPNGETCVKSVVHIGPHVRSGLLKWLAQGAGEAVIRVYHEADADRLEPIETELFARFGWAPFTKESVTLREKGGLSFRWVLLLGLFAPSETIDVRLRVVCFAKSRP